MVVDTSALIAIMGDEPERRAFNELIDAATAISERARKAPDAGETSGALLGGPHWLLKIPPSSWIEIASVFRSIGNRSEPG